MNRITIQSRVGGDGILQLCLPVGPARANEDVRVTVESIAPSTVTPEQWRQSILDTAGKWQGEFERPEQGKYERREPL